MRAAPAGLPREQPREFPRRVIVALALASVASAEDRQTIRELTRELQLARHDNVGVDHDLRIAMAGALVGLTPQKAS